jgi:hypothetical protein
MSSAIVIKTDDGKHSEQVEFYARLVSGPHYGILKYGILKVYEIV